MLVFFTTNVVRLDRRFKFGTIEFLTDAKFAMFMFFFTNSHLFFVVISSDYFHFVSEKKKSHAWFSQDFFSGGMW